MAQNNDEVNLAPKEREKSEVVDILMNMFREVMDRDAVMAVVESCDGDLLDSTEALMQITNEDYNQQIVIRQTPLPFYPQPELQLPQTPPIVNEIPSTMSYSNAFKSTGAVPKVRAEEPIKQSTCISDSWTPQLKKIITYHNKGFRTLILMRGVPGSGKTHLSKKIVEMTVGADSTVSKSHIFSADDYFYCRNEYRFDRTLLTAAHDTNKMRVKNALQTGLSPVIVDNTNIEMWEMEPYVREGIIHGYFIEIVEPQTTWAKNAYELSKKNVHGVPVQKIRQMLDKYHENLTADVVIATYGLRYPPYRIPPVMRTLPMMYTTVDSLQERTPVVEVPMVTEKTQNNISIKQNQVKVPDNADAKVQLEIPTARPVKVESSPIGIEEVRKLEPLEAIEKKINEFKTVEKEWEMGEEWVEVDSKGNSVESLNAASIAGPRPKRMPRHVSESNVEDIYKNIDKQDWKDVTQFMPPWNNNLASTSRKEYEITLEKSSIGTCMDIGDTNTNVDQRYKVLKATPKDINYDYIPCTENKIPNVRMLDKSSMTNDQLITEGAYRCKNSEKHFIALRKMFKNVSTAVLRDIFEKCCGDVNWVVEIMLDGYKTNKIIEMDGDNIVSDTEDDEQEQCDCLASYNIIPNVDSSHSKQMEVSTGDNDQQFMQKRKIKKEKTTSQTSEQLKKHIEENIVISDEHYSAHCLKIRNYRHGEISNNVDNGPVPSTSHELSQQSEESLSDTKESEKTESDDSGANSPKEIDVYLGKNLIAQLDEIFGRTNIKYHKDVLPLVTMPKTLLNEIDALWQESYAHQIQCQKECADILMAEDADFARKLAEKEVELNQDGKEPEVLDFKEIMDLDLALSIYQKDASEWHKNLPNDMAARMTREKLNNLFPDVSHNVLAELLMAHDNNFKTTVEVLLMSTGQTDILEQKNGVNKFIQDSERMRHDKLLAEEKRQASSGPEWPLLTMVSENNEPVDMSTVEHYRAEGRKHLEIRNLNQMKAQEFMQRGMIQVASYYSEIALYHKQKYEQANSMAATSLIQVHSKDRGDYTLDLHFLYVTEAIQTLDLFLDHQIRYIRENRESKGIRFCTLFIITGRGIHSKGLPKIKPAVQQRLKQRKIQYKPSNPGLISAVVFGDEKLTNEISKKEKS